MRICKLVFLCLLAASPALGSAIKGHRDDPPAKGYREEAPIKGHQAREELPVPPAKGGRLLAPIEQHRLAERHQVRATEQLPVQQQAEQRLEELGQQKEEALIQQKEEQQTIAPTKTIRYEARPQLPREELAKGQKVEQQREEAAKGKLSEQKEEKIEQKLEQAKQESYEEQQQQQQVEIRDEQRRYEEQRQQLEEQRALEEQRHLEESQAVQQTQVIEEHSAVKGAALAPAPAAMAEPYAFDYSIEGSSRRESGDARGVVRGQYTLQGADGSSRVVDYVADHNGFRASVNTNEFGTESQAPAGIALRSSQPSAEEISLGLEGKTKEQLAPPVPPKPENWQVKSPLQQQPHQAPLAQSHISYAEEAPRAVKGQRLEETQQLELPRATLAEPQQQLPAKSAELKAPKTSLSELKAAVGQQRAFESATAHRSPIGHRQQQVLATPVRQVPLTRSQPVATGYVVRGPAPAVPPRTHQPKTDRRPASPAQGYRRGHYVADAAEPIPRFSFYSSNTAHGSSFDDDLPLSFEQPSELK